MNNYFNKKNEYIYSRAIRAIALFLYFLFIIIIILKEYTIYIHNNNHKPSLGVIYY